MAEVLEAHVHADVVAGIANSRGTGLYCFSGLPQCTPNLQIFFTKEKYYEHIICYIIKGVKKKSTVFDISPILEKFWFLLLLFFIIIIIIIMYTFPSTLFFF